jgi:alanine racemase
MDGQMDLLAVDVNDNGQIDEGEAANIQDWNVSVSDIAQQAPGSDAYLAQNDGMPDYMNDADVSSLA